MELKKLFLEQLEREGEASRKAIERVPEGKNTWKPHAKSMELGYLAALVAAMPGWIGLVIRTEELDLGDPNRPRPKGTTNRAELLAALEKALADSRKELNNTTEEHLMKHWKLRLNYLRAIFLTVACLTRRLIWSMKSALINILYLKRTAKKLLK